MYSYDNISLNFTQNEECFRQNSQRKSKQIFYVNYVFFPRKSCRLCDNVEKCGRAGQVTDGSIITAQAHCMLGN